MRMRKKKNLIPRLERCAHLMIPCEQDDPLPICELSSDKPVHLEIGCGKGRFIRTLSGAHPEIFFLAVEREKSALLSALESALEEPLDNLRFLNTDAGRLSALLPQNSVSRLYINFCDPWPHKRHEKRRLTGRAFLNLYDVILQKEGELHFKTDNETLFDFSIREMTEDPRFAIFGLCRDLHASGEDNVRTEYEERFASAGMKIFRLKARRI